MIKLGRKRRRRGGRRIPKEEGEKNNGASPQGSLRGSGETGFSNLGPIKDSIASRFQQANSSDPGFNVFSF